MLDMRWWHEADQHRTSETPEQRRYQHLDFHDREHWRCEAAWSLCRRARNHQTDPAKTILCQKVGRIAIISCPDRLDLLSSRPGQETIAMRPRFQDKIKNRNACKDVLTSLLTACANEFHRLRDFAKRGSSIFARKWALVMLSPYSTVLAMR